MSNSWILHIKQYSKQHNLSYACALSNPDCRTTYKTKKSSVMSKKEIINKLQSENSKIHHEMKNMLNGSYTKAEEKQNKLDDKKRQEFNERTKDIPMYEIKYKKKIGVLY